MTYKKSQPCHDLSSERQVLGDGPLTAEVRVSSSKSLDEDDSSVSATCFEKTTFTVTKQEEHTPYNATQMMSLKVKVILASIKQNMVNVP